MIDIDELRRLAQATNEHSDDRAEILAEFYAATQSDTIIEILERLEAAESARRDDYQNWMTALDRNAELLAKLEAAEKERDEFKRECFGHISDNSLLRAKVEAMEKQEPVAWMGRGPRDGRIEFSVDKPSPSVMRDFNMTPLYTLPGAQGEEK